MAAVAEMGEVDDIPSKEESRDVLEDVLCNGSIADDKLNEKKKEEEKTTITTKDVTQKMDDCNTDEPEQMEVDNTLSDNDETVNDPSDNANITQVNTDSKDVETPDELVASTGAASDNDQDDEVHTIESDDEEIQETNPEKTVDDTIELNDANEDEDNENDVVMIVDDNDEVKEVEDSDDVKEMDVDDDDVKEVNAETIKENGTKSPDKDSDDCTVIDTIPTKKSVQDAQETITPRRSSRQQAQQAKRVSDTSKQISDESDIEEILEEDPLADSEVKKTRKPSTIVVNDTKRLVEIASKSSPPNTGKKEPTLVIIDTNSILSGRGPVPVGHQKTATTTSQSFNVLPMALPAQGLYPPNMRATITPIPITTTTKPLPPLTPVTSTAGQTAILPSLTDDMFVVEAPSFIVPYVYEKPPVKEFREYVNELRDAIKKEREKEEEKNGEKDDDVEEIKSEGVEEIKDDDNRKTYFESPIGKLFTDIGYNLVQEYVQTDLLKQQKRKRDREGGANPETNKTIQSLLKSLEYTKENNEPYKTTLKKCEFCSYKTDSMLAMAFHLETPHMKNFVYRCNFCKYEVRSPHDILFHMEAEHCVRGRLERAPAFHQCPNCPFEDNQKGKLSRHTVACGKKFKPDRNLEPPLDWEPPAKIPRQPRMKTPNLAMTAAMYQAMAKSSQAQFIKSQAAALNQSAANRGRGRPPSLGMPSKPNKPKKMQDLMPTVPGGGGSVLVPTNFQISGNQLYQVVGGQELGSRQGGPVGLFPTMSSTSNSITIQNTTPKTKTVHQPSISITPLPRGSTSSALNVQGGGAKPGDSNSKNSFVICEICDGYIKDLEQLRNHMQWIHKVKIHPKMIYNRPPLNCQKCQFRFFTDQGLERHLLGSHGLVTSSMQEAANKCKDSGRCPVCGRVYQWKLLNHVARDHNMTLKPAHLSYKCTVCTATFGMYKQFENHVYSAHSVVAKRSIDKKNTNSSSSNKSESLLKPLKINDEITIIPQMPKSNGAGSSKDHSPASSSRSNNANNTPGTSRIGDTSITRGERLSRRKTLLVGDSD